MTKYVQPTDRQGGPIIAWELILAFIHMWLSKLTCGSSKTPFESWPMKRCYPKKETSFSTLILTLWGCFVWFLRPSCFSWITQWMATWRSQLFDCMTCQWNIMWQAMGNEGRGNATTQRTGKRIVTGEGFSSKLMFLNYWLVMMNAVSHLSILRTLQKIHLGYFQRSFLIPRIVSHYLSHCWTCYD